MRDSELAGQACPLFQVGEKLGRLRALGLLMRAGRAAALCELVLHVCSRRWSPPRPSASTTQCQRAAAGGIWSRYATR
jgi:hypothetical protein